MEWWLGYSLPQDVSSWLDVLWMLLSTLKTSELFVAHVKKLAALSSRRHQWHLVIWLIHQSHPSPWPACDTTVYIQSCVKIICPLFALGFYFFHCFLPTAPLILLPLSVLSPIRAREIVGIRKLFLCVTCSVLHLQLRWDLWDLGFRELE